MKTLHIVLLLISVMFLSIIPQQVYCQKYLDTEGGIKMLIVKDPFTDSRSGPELLKGPGLMLGSGIAGYLEKLDCNIIDTYEVKIPEDLQDQYGEWNRAALSNNNLARYIWSHDMDDYFILGLLSGSKSLCGMLAGLQHLGPGRKPLKDSRGQEIQSLVRIGINSPLRVGLIWVDSQASFNTPDITLDGDMDGMNVAMAAGLSNNNLRLKAGLNPAISTRYIIMAGVRDVNPHEQLNIDNSLVRHINFNDSFDEEMSDLCRITDIIYVHIDMSVLDISETEVHPDAFPGGPSSSELAVFLEKIFNYPKVAALGIASYPEERSEKLDQALIKILDGAVEGIKARNNN